MRSITFKDVNKMKEEILNYELRLGPVSVSHKVSKPVSKPVFDEASAYREIAELQRKFMQETHDNGETAQASRYQHEIVVLRQQIIQHQMQR